MEIGSAATVHMTVTAEVTARSLGSGDVDVLGTPALIALCEAAAVAAVADQLAPGTTTVGTAIEFRHLRPSQIGDDVTASATLAEIDGRRLRFEVVARSGDTELGSGSVLRAVVDRSAFATGAQR
jgi:predicted thioesterase